MIFKPGNGSWRQFREFDSLWPALWGASYCIV